MSEKPQAYLAWYCPFAQRAWIALLHKGVDYEHIEQNPYEKTKEWLSVSRYGLIPAIIHRGKSIYESDVCVQYINDAWPADGELFPSDPYERALVRMWAHRVEKQIVQPFYAMLMKESESGRDQAKTDILKGILDISAAMSDAGPFFLGKTFGYVDIMLAPFAQRIELVLRRVRYFEVPTTADFSRYHVWFAAVKQVDTVVKTFHSEEKLVELYALYATGVLKTDAERAEAVRKLTN